MPDFLQQLVQSGGLVTPNPMAAYENVLKMKKFQSEMKSAELSDEVKMMTMFNQALKMAPDIETYTKVYNYYSPKFPEIVAQAPTPTSFGKDEKKYRIWNVGTTEGLSAGIKLEQGEKTTFTVENTDGSVHEVELTRKEYEDGVANRTIDPKRTYPGKQTKESIANIRERAEATAAGTAAGKPLTTKEQAEADIAKSERLGARIGEDIRGEELERIVMEGRAGERTLEKIGAAGRAPEKPIKKDLMLRTKEILQSQNIDPNEATADQVAKAHSVAKQEEIDISAGKTTATGKAKAELEVTAPTPTKDIPKEVDARLSVLARAYNIGDVMGPEEKDVQAWFRLMRPLYTQYYKDLNAGKEVVEPEPLTPRQAGAIEAQQRIAPMVRERAKGDRKKAKALFLREMSKEGYTEGTDYIYKD